MANPAAIILYGDGQEESYTEAYVSTPHLASALLDEGIYVDEEALEEGLQHAVQVCLYLNVPVAAHFRPIHVHDLHSHLQDDWALSDLAFYLLLLNARTENAQVAYAQSWIIRRAFSSRH